MEKLGNKERVYITDSAVTAISGVTETDVIGGETSNTFNLNANLVEVSDKTTAWQKFISGVKGATLSVSLNVDKSNDKQTALLTAMMNGSAVNVFVGDLTEKKGFAFSAYVSSLSQTADNASVMTWSAELSVNGAVTSITA